MAFTGLPRLVTTDATEIHRRGRGVKQTGGKPQANRQVGSAQLFAIVGKLASQAREVPVLR